MLLDVFFKLAYAAIGNKITVLDFKCERSVIIIGSTVILS